jgi:hypothetical protein
MTTHPMESLGEWQKNAESRIRFNHAIFQQYISKVQRYIESGGYKKAAIFSQIIAEYAWQNHTGRFSSVLLEQLLHEIALKAQVATSNYLKHVPNARCERSTVLHVLTEAYELGGHTRLASRWIQRDSQHSHSVILTRHNSPSIPKHLEDSLMKTGGKLWNLFRFSSGFFERAKWLGEIAKTCDLVVLHIHPGDIVPVLAFADRNDIPPTVFLNHADHVFWIGASVCNFGG